MKVIAIPILILLILSQTFSKWLLIAQYNFNKEYIAKNFCENKSRPAIKCNGKCQLMKKMAADENTGTNQQNPNPGKEKTAELLYFENIASIDLKAAVRNPAEFQDYCLAIHVSPCFPIFHPPA